MHNQSFWNSPKRIRGVFIIAHLTLFCFFMWRFIISPNDVMVSGRNDGLKNFFTLQAYLEQPASDGYIDFTAMQYPYGDAVWYTDNSPFIAMPLRFIQLHFGNIAPYTVAIIQWIFLLGILLTPLTVIPVLRRFLNNEWLVAIGAIVITWTSPQFLRFFVGNYNLSLTPVYFLVMALLLRIYDNFQSRNRKKLLLHAALIAIVIFLASGIHLYYVILLGLPAIAFLGILFLQQIRKSAEVLYFTAIPSFAIAIATFGMMLLINTTDPWRSMRPTQLDGSNISAWEMRFMHLYKARDEVNLVPFIGGKIHFDPENGVYLGGFFWYLLLMVFILIAFRFFRYRDVSFIKTLKPSPVGWIFILTAIVAFFAGTGMHLHLIGRGNTMENIFNPLYYIGKIYPGVSQFRCIARMGWWLFYAAQIGILVAVERIILNQKKWIVNAVLCIGLSLLATDIYGIKQFTNSRFYPNYFNQKSLASLPDLDYDAYQAILPIPYYHVGCEEYDFTIDDANEWSRYTYQLQLKSHLPLMSVKLSRTPQLFASQMMQLLLEPQSPGTLHEYLNDKPILVIYDPSIEEKQNLEPAATVLKESPGLITSEHMVLIGSKGNVQYYAWYLKSN